MINLIPHKLNNQKKKKNLYKEYLDSSYNLRAENNFSGWRGTIQHRKQFSEEAKIQEGREEEHMRTILRAFVSKDRRYHPISISNVSDLTLVKSLGNKTLDQQVLENRERVRS